MDGKTEDGKTIYKNEDLSPHSHKQQQTQQSQQASTTIVTQATNESMILSKLQELEQKIDLLTKLVYAQQKEPQK